MSEANRGLPEAITKQLDAIEQKASGDFAAAAKNGRASASAIAAIADIDVVRLALASVLGRGHEERDVATSLKVVHRHVEQGCAWLPSNPLAVIEVAARLLAQRHGLTPSIELLGPDGAEGEPDWTCRLVVTSDIQVEAAGSREEIGVLVLREVCRG